MQGIWTGSEWEEGCAEMGEQPEKRLGGWYASLVLLGCGWGVKCPGRETGGWETFVAIEAGADEGLK